MLICLKKKCGFIVDFIEKNVEKNVRKSLNVFFYEKQLCVLTCQYESWLHHYYKKYININQMLRIAYGTGDHVDHTDMTNILSYTNSKKFM